MTWTFLSEHAVNCFSWILLTLLYGYSTTMSILGLPLTASIAALPVSPDVAVIKAYVISALAGSKIASSQKPHKNVEFLSSDW